MSVGYCIKIKDVAWTSLFRGSMYGRLVDQLVIGLKGIIYIKHPPLTFDDDYFEAPTDCAGVGLLASGSVVGYGRSNISGKPYSPHET